MKRNGEKCSDEAVLLTALLARENMMRRLDGTSCRAIF
jgi:hypothetical protein